MTTTTINYEMIKMCAIMCGEEAMNHGMYCEKHNSCACLLTTAAGQDEVYPKLQAGMDECDCGDCEDCDIHHFTNLYNTFLLELPTASEEQVEEFLEDVTSPGWLERVTVAVAKVYKFDDQWEQHQRVLRELCEEYSN